jgi:hypothetical protein
MKTILNTPYLNLRQLERVAGIPAGSLEPVKNGRRKLSARNTAKVLAVLQGLQGEIDRYLDAL